MTGKLSSGLPTPPTEECKPVSSSRKAAKSGKTSSSRGTKRSSATLSHEHGGIVLDGRHKRVWKACERCRMKKTKCDGESPCKRCKDDGLVCTAGSRKKTEYKQLPRGYAEVLENTQYALIATVQKLYTMVRNGETWDLGEPELNDRGLPVIHNIAEKLGCIRPSPDMPHTFPEDADEFAELQAQMFAGKLDSDGKHSDDSMSHPDRTERASSSESDQSVLSKDYSQMLWAQQQEQSQDQSLVQYQSESQEECPEIGDQPLYQSGYIKSEPISGVTSIPVAAPIYSYQSQNQIRSPVFRPESPFTPWSNSGEDSLGSTHVLDITALYMRQQQQQQQQLHYKQQAQLRMARAQLNSGLPTGFNMRANTYPLPGGDGTIRPNMLDCSQSLGFSDQMDYMTMGDYETMTLS